MVKKNGLRLLSLRLFLFVISKLPDCRLNDKLIEIILMSFPLEEIKKIVFTDEELKLSELPGN